MKLLTVSLYLFVCVVFIYREDMVYIVGFILNILSQRPELGSPSVVLCAHNALARALLPRFFLLNFLIFFTLKQCFDIKLGETIWNMTRDMYL
jgi:hypothetical protein